MTGSSHLAELEFSSTDVVAAWTALEPVVARSAATDGTPAARSDYQVGHPDGQSTVAGAELRDCLEQVTNPLTIAVTYTAATGSDADPLSVELRIMRYRRFKELNVHLRVTGPMDVHTLGFFERTRQALTHTIDSVSGPRGKGAGSAAAEG